MTVFKTIIKDRVFQITLAIAIITSFLARPRVADINFTTLWSLLAMMTTIQIFDYLHVLDFIAYKITARAHTARQLTALFVALSFISAMFLTNDMAVLTFIPLYLRIARHRKLPEILPVTAITIAANQGSAMTPFGNTHNIFLMAKFHIPIAQFGEWVVPMISVAIVFLAILIMFVPKIEIPNVPVKDIRTNPRLITLTCIVALLVFSSIFDIIPAWVAAVVAIAVAILINYKIMGQVDYAIVLTFAGFFVIISNINQIPAVAKLVSSVVGGPVSVYLTSILTSQFISNVPSTVLIANFTHHLDALFFGSNIGGLGTLVASMCNLVAFKQYTIYSQQSHSRFLLHFTTINFIALFIIGGAGLLAVVYLF
ncbi:SLC13 family permease [Lacticaseibacillus sharpeae]|uniref:Di-and tricarboxylate transporter n=1 Tax=Lacticaseibacillus sharpeae JCM 1186 = DSM 20505 TaxID=1291052 RepID=A0A0R1ZS50_9LACO|nr:SLC13 family permease [Lacticaseibacillus sharpeae]KRM54518.1 di-and tricarboxylate transporter [Lacticaseibacillus sharpeae JCM 1186 = DSM 20505]